MRNMENEVAQIEIENIEATSSRAQSSTASDPFILPAQEEELNNFAQDMDDEFINDETLSVEDNISMIYSFINLKN